MYPMMNEDANNFLVNDVHPTKENSGVSELVMNIKGIHE
jgi:hypothetical protein